jgi:hypothetical protein
MPCRYGRGMCNDQVDGSGKWYMYLIISELDIPCSLFDILPTLQNWIFSLHI